MLRVVVDTSVVVAALRSRAGAGFQVLQLWRRSRFTALVSSALFLEYEAVLKRPDQLASCGASLEMIDEVLRQLAEVSHGVRIYNRWRPQLRDKDDEMVLEAAINGRADVLLTCNLKDFGDAAPRFGIRLLRPADLLREIG